MGCGTRSKVDVNSEFHPFVVVIMRILRKHYGYVRTTEFAIFYAQYRIHSIIDFDSDR